MRHNRGWKPGFFVMILMCSGRNLQAYWPAAWMEALSRTSVVAPEVERHFVDVNDDAKHAICQWDFQFSSPEWKAGLRVVDSQGHFWIKQNGKMLLDEKGLKCAYGEGVHFGLYVLDLNQDGQPDFVLAEEEIGLGIAQDALAWVWLSGPKGYKCRDLASYYALDKGTFLRFGVSGPVYILFRTSCYAPLKHVPMVQNEFPEDVDPGKIQHVLWNLFFDVGYLLRAEGYDLVFDQSPDARFPSVTSWWKFDIHASNRSTTKLLTRAQKAGMLSKNRRDMDEHPVIPDFVRMPDNGISVP